MRRGLVVLLLVLAACSSDKTATTTPASTASTAAPLDPSKVTARLVKVAAVDSPTAMAVRPKDDGVYVAEKTGRVRYVPQGQTANPAAPAATPVLDLSAQVSTGSEQGLLGLTFNAEGSKLYVDYTDRSGDTMVVEYLFKEALRVADPASARNLLFVDQPFANHNGGEVVFGPDGKLYVGLGDGGSGGDPGNRAQNLGTLLGKILRIDPAPGPAGKPYSIPGDNPFLERSGAMAEIWAYGLRNPWRFSWDRATHDFWVADVGQDKWEEVDVLAAGAPGGANYGWSLLEGTHRFKGDNPAGAVLPIFEYGHDQGCSVTGGFVYRGAKAPSLQGVYVYGDACTGKIWGLTQSGGKLTGQAELSLTGESADRNGGGTRFTISSFGEDAAGELYLLTLGGGVFRFDGA